MSRRLQRGQPAGEGAAEAEQSSPAEPRVLSGRCHGAAGWGGRGEKGVEMGFPPLGRALVEEAPGQPRAACFRLRSRNPAARTGSAEPRSARRTGPSVPGGQRLWLLGLRGLTPHRACPSSPGEHTGTPESSAALSGCKIHPPVPLLSLPSSRGRREAPPRARNLQQVADSSRCGSPGPPPPVTCEDSDTDLMVVVGEDHSLGRHVSQRSHRTDRSQEKPEPGARRPGARLPWRARERGRPGSARRAGRRGPSARWPAWGGGERPRQERAGPRRGRSRAARPRVRPGGSDPGVGVAAASRKTERGGGGARPARPRGSAE